MIMQPREEASAASARVQDVKRFSDTAKHAELKVGRRKVQEDIDARNRKILRDA